MNVDIKVWLFDIINAINEIDSFFDDLPKEYDSYHNSIKTKWAVERALEIIGDAMNRILNVNESIPISNARKIVDARNKIIHGYDKVSDWVIWEIITVYLPILKTEVEQLLLL